MEIPNVVLDTILTSMARSDLEEVKSDLEENIQIEPPKIKKPARRFKSNPIIGETITVLFSKDNKHRTSIQTILDDMSDGFLYRVSSTGRTYTSHQLAINNARKWLRKKRLKYYKKHPKERPRIKTVRLNPKPKNKIKTIKKLHIMEKVTAKILVRMSGKKLKMHNDYSRKKFNTKKTTAVSGDTHIFNIAISTVMKDGTKKERKLVAKMLKCMTHEPMRQTNMFY